MLSTSDHERIAAAVAKAEEGAAGEILCVLANHVSDYHETSLAWGVLAALATPTLAVALGLHAAVLSWAAGDWLAADSSTLSGAFSWALTLFALGQAAIFAIVAWVIDASRPVKLALTPSALKHRRVRQAALAQLLAVQRLSSQSGVVVIFASVEDRMVAVVADETIHAKVGDHAWDKAVAAVQAGVRAGDPAAGFVDAVALCGEALGTHFPATGPHGNRLPDDILEI